MPNADLPIRSRSGLRRIAVTAVFVLLMAGCQSAVEVQMIDSASQTDQQADVGGGQDSTTTDTSDQTDPADGTDLEADDAATDMEDGATDDNTTDTGDAGDGDSTTEDGATEDEATEARFVVQGSLPLPVAEVNDILAFIEDSTGRAFLRPPVIVAQTNEQFMAGLAEDIVDFEDDAEATVRTLQAMGLTDKGVAEVAAAFQELLLSPDGILGYYDPEADQLYVPVDASVDDEFRSLLVHELTHALDGQHSDLTRLQSLVDLAEETGNFEPVVGLQAVGEGRATAVQNQWMTENDVVPGVAEDLGVIEAVPPAMVLSLSLPYVFGEQYVVANGGPSETWDLLDNPPDSSEEFLVPFTPVDEPIVDVAVPTAEGPVIEDTVFGAVDFLVWLLGASLEPDSQLVFPTLTAIDGWAGGRSVLWGDETESCISIALAADSGNDLDEFETAIDLWVDRGPDRSVVNDGELVVATGCAPFVA